MTDNQPPRQPIKSSVDNDLDSAVNKTKEAGSEAGQHAKHAADKAADKVSGAKKRGDTPDEGQLLKIVGGAVAVVAAVVIGVKVVKHRKSKREEAEEEASGILDGAGRSLKNTGRWFGEKAEVAKDKAGEVADDVGPRVKGAANATKDKVNDAVPSQVSGTAADIKDRVGVAGIKVEREGLKASEASDAAVRDAADKILHTSGRAATKVDTKSGGLFSNIRSWLADRSDDAAEASEAVANKVEETFKGNGKK